MDIKKISAIVFSPTDSTRAIVSTITAKIVVPSTLIDITCHGSAPVNPIFSGDELVVFGIPVYGGRVPAVALEKIRKLHGAQTPAVLVATYGNREYEDALLELKNVVEENGFIVVAAAAFVTEHSIMHSVAKGRPDDADQKAIADFAHALWAKLQGADSVAALSVAVKGHLPYTQYGGVPLKPKATKACNGCGTCAVNCPVGAISPDLPKETNHEACISCMRCMKVCPLQARKLNQMLLSVAEKAFAIKCAARKEPEVFL